MVCPNPFERAEIHHSGEVYTCCPTFINEYSIGNVFKTPFASIWNGEKAYNLRKKLLENDYSLCSDTCNRKNYFLMNKTSDYDSCQIPYPHSVSISCDTSCNIRCIFCRDTFIHNNFSQQEVEREVNDIWLPVLKGVKILELGVNSEPLSNLKETFLLKRAAEVYPDIRFQIHTNGILGTEKRLKELGIYNRMENITVSLHSATEKTHSRVVPVYGGGKTFRRILDNIKTYSKMREKGLLKRLALVFVVFSENYQDIPKFVKLAADNNAQAVFWGLRKVSVGGNKTFMSHYDDYDILNPNHKDHNKLLEVLKNPILKDSVHVDMFPEIKNLIKE